MARRAEREHALLGAALFLVAPRAAKARIETVVRQRLLERFGLHHLRVGRGAVVEWIDVLLEPFAIDVHQEVDAVASRDGVAEGDHLPELPGGIDVEKRKRHPRRMERFQCQVKHD